MSVEARRAADINAAGLACNRAGDFKQAALLFLQAHEADPSRAPYLISAANMMLKLGDMKNARQLYRRARDMHLTPQQASMIAAKEDLLDISVDAEMPASHFEPFEVLLDAKGSLPSGGVKTTTKSEATPLLPTNAEASPISANLSPSESAGQSALNVEMRSVDVAMIGSEMVLCSAAENMRESEGSPAKPHNLGPQLASMTNNDAAVATVQVVPAPLGENTQQSEGSPAKPHNLGPQLASMTNNDAAVATVEVVPAALGLKEGEGIEGGGGARDDGLVSGKSDSPALGKHTSVPPLRTSRVGGGVDEQQQQMELLLQSERQLRQLLRQQVDVQLDTERALRRQLGALQKEQPGELPNGHVSEVPGGTKKDTESIIAHERMHSHLPSMQHSPLNLQDEAGRADGAKQRREANDAALSAQLQAQAVELEELRASLQAEAADRSRALNQVSALEAQVRNLLAVSAAEREERRSVQAELAALRIFQPSLELPRANPSSVVPFAASAHGMIDKKHAGVCDDDEIRNANTRNARCTEADGSANAEALQRRIERLERRSAAARESREAKHDEWLEAMHVERDALAARVEGAYERAACAERRAAAAEATRVATQALVKSTEMEREALATMLRQAEVEAASLRYNLSEAEARSRHVQHEMQDAKAEAGRLRRCKTLLQEQVSLTHRVLDNNVSVKRESMT